MSNSHHASAHIPDEAVQAKRNLIQSYDWSFKSTGVDAIDDILSSIADAAESYHNTSQWKDEGHIDRIQKYADVAAAHLSAPCAVEVDALAQEIRRVNGKNDLGAGALAEALIPFLSCVVTKPVDVPALLQEVRNGERDGFINTGQEPHGNDADLSCPYCGGSGHKDDVVTKTVDQDAKDFEAIGRAYMAAFETVTSENSEWSGYTPSECPSELLLDIYAAQQEAKPVDVAAVLRQALEEAAKALDAWGDIYGSNAASCVRALSAEPAGGTALAQGGE